MSGSGGEIRTFPDASLHTRLKLAWIAESVLADANVRDVVIVDLSLVHLSKRALLADQDAVLRDDPGHIAFKGGNADQEQPDRHGQKRSDQWRAA